jgi:hypothetical protein
MVRQGLSESKIFKSELKNKKMLPFRVADKSTPSRMNSWHRLHGNKWNTLMEHQEKKGSWGEKDQWQAGRDQIQHDFFFFIRV